MAEKQSFFQKYFNSSTMAGRANVSKATYASIALLYIFFRLKRSVSSSPPPPVQAPSPHEHGSAHGDRCRCKEHSSHHNEYESHGRDPHENADHGGDKEGAHGAAAAGAYTDSAHDSIEPQQKRKC